MKTRICRMTHNEWNQVLTGFADACIYQTWAYPAARWGEKRLSQFIMEDNNGVKAAALIRNLTPPGLQAGLSYVSMGPMWRLKGRPADPRDLTEALTAMWQSLAVERGMHLRLRPNFTLSQLDDTPGLLEATGFKSRQGVRPYETLMIDLAQSSDEIMASFHGKWRNSLKKGLKAECEILVGRQMELFDQFLGLQHEMAERKHFQERLDLQALRQAQSSEAEENQLIIFLAMRQGEPLAAAAISWLGDTAIYLLGASSPQGRKLNASYVLQWEIITKLKEWDCRWYDLGGVNTSGKSGVLLFKQRLAGKNGKHIELIGEIEAKGGVLSQGIVRVLDWIVKVRG